MAKSKVSKKLNSTLMVLIATVVVIVALVTSLMLASSKDKSDDEGSNHTDPTTGLNIEYKSDLTLIPYNPPDQNSVLFNLRRSNPLILINATYQQGEGVASLDKEGNPLTSASITDNIAAKLDESYKQVEILNKKSININGKNGGEIIFTHVSAGIPTTQRLTLLIRDDDMLVQIICQTPTADYESVNSQYFEPLISSARFE